MTKQQPVAPAVKRPLSSYRVLLGSSSQWAPSSLCCHARELSLGHQDPLQGHQDPLQHEVMDLPAPLGALLGLLLQQPHVAETILGCHVFTLCPFAAA